MYAIRSYYDSDLFSKEIKEHSEDIYAAFESSNSIGEAFSKISQGISIDYGIMEKSENVAVVPVDIGWNDLGSFDAFYDVFEKDENDNIIGSENIVIDSKNNYIHSDTGKLITAVGVEDLIA